MRETEGEEEREGAPSTWEASVEVIILLLLLILPRVFVLPVFLGVGRGGARLGLDHGRGRGGAWLRTNDPPNVIISLLLIFILVHFIVIKRDEVGAQICNVHRHRITWGLGPIG